MAPSVCSPSRCRSRRCGADPLVRAGRPRPAEADPGGRLRTSRTPEPNAGLDISSDYLAGSQHAEHVCSTSAALWLAGLLFLASATASLVTAQTSTPRRTVWDGVYTEAQAARGMMAFGQSCAGCHALAAEGKAPLAGDPFWKSFAQKTVGDLLEFVSANMPNGSPRFPQRAHLHDIVALMLKSNGFPAGATELGRNTIADVQIVPKDGSAELPANALARVVGCLARSGADWVVTSATTPERAERVAPGGEDATQAPRQPYDAAQVRRDQAGCVGRFARLGERAPDRRRRRGRHQRDGGKPRRTEVPLNRCL